jgi:hypothetical protein
VIMRATQEISRVVTAPLSMVHRLGIRLDRAIVGGGPQLPHLYSAPPSLLIEHAHPTVKPTETPSDPSGTQSAEPSRQADQAELLTHAFNLIEIEIYRKDRNLPPLPGVARIIDKISSMVSVDGRGKRPEFVLR